MRRGTISVGTVALSLLVQGCSGGSPNSATIGDRLIKAASEPQNWLMHGGTYAEQRFSPLTAISTANVGQLGLAWAADLQSERGQESTPLVVDGTMYVTLAWSKVVALNAATGREKWRYDPKVPGRFGVSACCDVVNRGAAFDDGRIFVGTIDGRLIALDAKSGKPLWSDVTVDQSKPYTITGAPRVAKGLVLIGNGGAEYGVRGYVSAYDTKTGKLAWRFYTVPGDPARKDGAASDATLEKLARPTWFGDAYYKYGGGGTVWDSIVYDPELDRVYIGVGNGGPWNRKIRSEDKGDNLFLGSIVALDAKTGAYVWHYQETPGDTWDFTSSQQIILATLPIDGKLRRLILHAPKNGFFYVIDRDSGKLVSAEKFAPVNWASVVDKKTGRPVENPEARFQTKPFIATIGASGAHNWQPMAFSPKTGLVYIPAQEVPFLYVKDTKFAYRKDLWNLGVDMMSTPLPETPAAIAGMKKALQGRLIAWDPIRQKEVWRAPHAGTWNGGVLATAGDLVFQGLSDGTFRAYRAADGKELWKFDAQTGLLPGPISYSVDGVQYVAITAGNGGGFALALPVFDPPRAQPPARMLAFRIGGKEVLPPLPARLPASIVKAHGKWSEAQIAEGAKNYGQICAACHGMGTLSAGIIPDLRRSGALADNSAWRAVVIDGALADRGMASFANYITPAQAEMVRGYVARQAAKAASRGGK